MAGNHTLGTIRGTIEIDYDGAGIVKAVRDTEKTKKSFGSLGGASDKVLGTFGKFAKGAAVTAGSINLVHNALSLVAGTLAIVGPLAAAAFASAPGVILAYASAMVIFKIAVAGVGDALKNAGGDAKKFNESIKNLSPEAQKFAKAFRAAYPALVQVKKAIQDAFFKGSAGQVGGVVKAIGTLKTIASQVAREMGLVAQHIAKVVTSSKSLTAIKAILGGLRDFIQQAGAAIAPLIQSFLRLGGQAGAFGGILGGSVAAGLTHLTDFVNSVNLSQLFATAAPIVKSLGQFLGDVATIAGQLFSVFNVDGANAAGVLAALASQLAAFLQSAQGQAALQALGQAMQAISGAAGQIFLALLQALAPAIVALAPGVGQLAGQISGLLVPAINALAPVLASVAGWLSQNMGWIGPLAAAVVGLAGAYKVYSAAATAVGAVQAVIASKAVAAAAGWIANTAAIVANRVAMAANAAITGGAAVAAWVANTAAIVANRVATVAAQAVMLVVRGATMAWAAAQWVLNAALNANPLGIAIALIAALVAGIIYAWHNSETFRNVVLAVWAAIKTAIAAAVGWITGTAWPWIQRTWQAIQIATQILWGQIKSIWNGIKNAISTAVNAIRSVVVSVWNAIVNFVRAYINAYKAVVMAGFNAARAAVSSAMNAVRSVVSSIWSAIRSIISSAINQIKNSIAGIKIIINTIRNAFNNAKSAASAGISTIVSLVRGLPGKAAGALGNLGSLLYSKGKALVQGFINGIASMIGAVADKAQSVVHAVTKFLPGSPAEEGPLSGKGYVLLRARRFMNDFAQGLNDGSEKPASVLAGSVAGVARATVPSGSVTKSGASTAATTPAVAIGTRTYKVAIGDKEFAEIVVDAITGEPVAVSKASKEGDRRSAWSGSGR